MILLTRFNGPVFALNPDLIERADHTPDTVLTLVDGTKYVVAEPLDELIQIMRRHRAGVLADAELLINGHFREAGWPPAGQPAEEQATGPRREPALGAVPTTQGRGEGKSAQAADLGLQINDSSARHPSSLGPVPVPAPLSEVIPLHRRDQ